MAFERQTPRTPVAIADIAIQLFDPEAGSGQQPSASYNVQVRWSDGTVRVLRGDLVPQLTSAQVQGLLNFMGDLRVQANNQILPTP